MECPGYGLPVTGVKPRVRGRGTAKMKLRVKARVRGRGAVKIKARIKATVRRTGRVGLKARVRQGLYGKGYRVREG